MQHTEVMSEFTMSISNAILSIGPELQQLYSSMYDGMML